MTVTKLVLLLAVIVALVALPGLRAQDSATRIDTAFQKFWNAKSPDEADRFTEDVLKSGVAFDEAYLRLKAGRTYTTQKTGIVMLTNRTKDGVEHFYALNV